MLSNFYHGEISLVKFVDGMTILRMIFDWQKELLRIFSKQHTVRISITYGLNRDCRVRGSEFDSHVAPITFWSFFHTTESVFYMNG